MDLTDLHSVGLVPSMLKDHIVTQEEVEDPVQRRPCAVNEKSAKMIRIEIF
jgi:hypothetical protein